MSRQWWTTANIPITIPMDVVGGAGEDADRKEMCCVPSYMEVYCTPLQESIWADFI